MEDKTEGFNSDLDTSSPDDNDSSDLRLKNLAAKFSVRDEVYLEKKEVENLEDQVRIQVDTPRDFVRYPQIDMVMFASVIRQNADQDYKDFLEKERIDRLAYLQHVEQFEQSEYYIAGDIKIETLMTIYIFCCLLYLIAVVTISN